MLKLERRTHDRAVWWSETPFKITKIEKEKENPQNIRLAEFPFLQDPVTTSQAGELFVAKSGVLRDDAYGQEYKITFTMNGSTIDPNMDCVNN